jgi:hypothetical protein
VLYLRQSDSDLLQAALLKAAREEDAVPGESDELRRSLHGRFPDDPG